MLPILAIRTDTMQQDENWQRRVTVFHCVQSVGTV